MQLAPGEIEPADDHGKHVVEVVRDAAGQLADRLHLLHLAELRLGGGALGRLALQALIGGGELAGARLHGLLEVERVPAHLLGLAPALEAVDEGPPGEEGEADRAQPHEDAEQAEQIGIGVRPVRQPLGRGRAPGEIGALGRGDLLELRAEQVQRVAARGLFQQAAILGAAALLDEIGGRPELGGALPEEPRDLGGALRLGGIAAHEPLQFVDLRPCPPPRVIICGRRVARRGALALILEHEAAELGLGARNAGVDVAGEQEQGVGAPLPAQGLVAGAVRLGDEEDEADQGKRRQQRASTDPKGTPGVRTALLGRNAASLLRHMGRLRQRTGRWNPGAGGSARGTARFAAV